MSKETNGKSNRTKPTKQRRVFKNFAEYWHFLKLLSEEQREVISKSLSVDERRSLRASFHRGGWNDLMMRNTCDLVLDRIKKETGVDFLDIRTRVILGKSVLMHVTLWEYINKSFDGIEWEHISYIFDGVVAEDYDTDYVKLVLYQPQE